MKNIKLTIIALLLFGLFLVSPSTFAANPYGIEYTGGEPLGASNVTIDPGLLDELDPIIDVSYDNAIEFSDSGIWKTVYGKNGSRCMDYHVLEIHKGDTISPESRAFYSVSNGTYRIEVHIKNVLLENLYDIMSESDVIVVYVNPTGGIGVGVEFFSDQSCQEQISGYIGLGGGDYSRKVFVETDIKLYSVSTNSVVNSDGLYFGLTDIDASQSYKILNQNNQLLPSNMYAKSTDVLQPTGTNLRNMYVYVADGNYIYSEPHFNTQNSDIFVQLGSDVNSEGIDMVFGFAYHAASGIRFYAKQYRVFYESDDNGIISGISDEDIIAGGFPSGSITTPNKHYVVKYWTVNENVKLKNGAVIAAGERLSPEQIKQVVVDKDLTFIAYHETVPDTPGDQTDPDEPDEPEEPEKPDIPLDQVTPEDDSPTVPNTGANISGFGSGNLGLIGSVASGILLAFGGMAIYRVKIKKQIRKLS